MYSLLNEFQEMADMKVRGDCRNPGQIFMQWDPVECAAQVLR
jgi:hypothetical protein